MSEVIDLEDRETARSRLGSLRDRGKPIVLEYKSKKKKKRRYSKGLEDVQEVEAGLSRAIRKATSAIAEGTATYDKARRKSARQKKDGAIRDFIPNMGEALSESLREASDIPADVADTLNTKSNRRRLRRRIRDVSDALDTWRLT
jgi:predicted  nucleic acid-binding Zn-ribbon protein